MACLLVRGQNVNDFNRLSSVFISSVTAVEDDLARALRVEISCTDTLLKILRTYALLQSSCR